MKVRMVGYRSTTNVGVAHLGAVRFVDGVAEISPDRFDDLALACRCMGIKVIPVAEKKPPQEKPAKVKKEKQAAKPKKDKTAEEPLPETPA